MIRALIASLALSGCAFFDHPKDEAFYAHGYMWKQGPKPKCERIVWHQIAGACPAGMQSCAVGCYVFSPYSEADAKRINVHGISLWHHEVEWHINRGLSHP